MAHLADRPAGTPGERRALTQEILGLALLGLLLAALLAYARAQAPF